jgi:hypothetical protein
MTKFKRIFLLSLPVTFYAVSPAEREKAPTAATNGYAVGTTKHRHSPCGLAAGA